MSRGKRFESARRLSIFLQNPGKREAHDVRVERFVSSTSAVDYPKALSSALACYKWLQGTTGGVGRSSGMDGLTDVPGFRRTRHRRQAPPECLGDRFCELRLNGVLRSSSWQT